MEIDIEPVRVDNCTIEMKKGMVMMRGALYTKESETCLSPFFELLHKALMAEKAARIIVDMVELTSLNSAGIKVLAAWISIIDNLPEDKKYRIIFRCNSAHLWQETSITTLIMLSPGIVSKEFVGNFKSYV